MTKTQSFIELKFFMINGFLLFYEYLGPVLAGIVTLIYKLRAHFLSTSHSM